MLNVVLTFVVSYHVFKQYNLLGILAGSEVKVENVSRPAHVFEIRTRLGSKLQLASSAR